MQDLAAVACFIVLFFFDSTLNNGLKEAQNKLEVLSGGVSMSVWIVICEVSPYRNHILMDVVLC